MFDRQGRVADELLRSAFALPAERWDEAGAAGGPSLRRILADWLEAQRRAVNQCLLDRPYRPLPPQSTATLMEYGRSFGGFRMTLRNEVERIAEEEEGLVREVVWTASGGSPVRTDVDALFTHLLLHGARMLGLAAERLRQCGVEPPPLDLLDIASVDAARPARSGEEE